jgi:hypothetical protein
MDANITWVRDEWFRYQELRQGFLSVLTSLESLLHQTPLEEAAALEQIRTEINRFQSTLSQLENQMQPWRSVWEELQSRGLA